jgi:hypothetical protein
MIEDITISKTLVYSFTLGYMVSQFNILGFALGCGCTLAIQYIPMEMKNHIYTLYNNAMVFIKFKNN